MLTIHLGKIRPLCCSSNLWRVNLVWQVILSDDINKVTCQQCLDDAVIYGNPYVKEPRGVLTIKDPEKGK